ncbi:unnamed protein product [Periconia digitata]|uniref:Uncharacterized protein n=1 Tax=Periconia digitata TaxID=1303443 RepID=A0A9W4U5U3_9PLEO|nr:unnamed protein product [Periconia digitata]
MKIIKTGLLVYCDNNAHSINPQTHRKPHNPGRKVPYSRLPTTTGSTCAPAHLTNNPRGNNPLCRERSKARDPQQRRQQPLNLVDLRSSL